MLAERPQEVEATMMSVSQEATTQEAIVAFAAAKGNIYLAAERLNIPVTLLTQLLSEDQELLLHHLKTMTIINTFEALGQAHANLKTAIPEMEPYEQAKLYTNLLSVAEQQTRDRSTPTPPPSTQVNILQMMQALPPEAREAVNFLLQAPTEPESDGT